MNRTVLTIPLVLALSSTVVIDDAHSAPSEAVAESPAAAVESSASATPDKGDNANATGSQKGTAYIQFFVFGFERSITDLASKLTLDIDYQVVEDGWTEDRVEYTVTGKVVDIEKFYSTIQSSAERFRLEQDPLVLDGTPKPSGF